MINFDADRISFIDNLFARMAPEIYTENQECVSAWHRVLDDFKKYIPEYCYRHYDRHDIEYISLELAMESINKLDEYIRQNIYELTKVDRYITTYWKRAKDGLTKFCYKNVSNNVKYFDFMPKNVNF